MKKGNISRDHDVSIKKTGGTTLMPQTRGEAGKQGSMARQIVTSDTQGNSSETTEMGYKLSSCPSQVNDL